jgi:hypothetical protein
LRDYQFSDSILTKVSMIYESMKNEIEMYLWIEDILLIGVKSFFFQWFHWKLVDWKRNSKFD